MGPKTVPRSRGVALVELMISLGVLTLVVAIVIPSMIYFGRAVHGLRYEQDMLQRTSFFFQWLSTELTRATEVQLEGSNRVVIRGFTSEYVEDSAAATGYRYDRFPVTTELFYEDDDDNPDTIGDNRLRYRRVVRDLNGNIVHNREGILLRNVSPVESVDSGEDALPVFQMVTTQTRPYVEVNLRIGDRENPPSMENAAVTGPGYQSFVVRHVLVPYNLPAS